MPSTFPTSPQPLRIYTTGIEFKVLVSEAENGSEQRRAVWPHGKRSFALQYDVLNQTEMETLWNFYVNTASGVLNTFTFYDNVSGANYTCRFTENKLSMEQFFYRVYRTGINLVEVF